MSKPAICVTGQSCNTDDPLVSSSETLAEPWDTISVDFIVKLPESHGYDAFMNVINSVTKRMHFIPMHTTITAKGAACLYLREIWKHHGTP
jgi:hypothetical protein